MCFNLLIIFSFFSISVLTHFWYIHTGSWITSILILSFFVPSCAQVCKEAIQIYCFSIQTSDLQISIAFTSQQHTQQRKYCLLNVSLGTTIKFVILILMNPILYITVGPEHFKVEDFICQRQQLPMVQLLKDLP